MIRLLVADDDALVRGGLRTLLQTEPDIEVVGEAADGVEAETLRLVARGRSNQEIADEFVVAVHTVKTHVARILAKLEVRDRTQAVVLAYETGFVQPGE